MANTTAKAPQNSPYLTVREAAEMLRCHQRTVRRMIASGSVVTYHAPGSKKVLLKRDELMAGVEASATVR